MSLLPEPTSKQKVYKRTQRRRIPQCYAVTYASIKLLRAMRRPCHSPSPLPEVFFFANFAHFRRYRYISWPPYL